jgi:ribosomal protein S18 acetylase RimI-like enzyme
VDMMQEVSSGNERWRYRLVPASTRDETWLAELRRSVYQELFHTTFGGWDEERHIRHSKECWDGAHISLIWIDATPAGMVQIFEEADAVEIGEIQIQPSHQNLGIGSQILTDVLRRSHQQGKSVKLSTGLKNERAHKLYQRLGFRSVGQSETHYHFSTDPRRPTHSGPDF